MGITLDRPRIIGGTKEMLEWLDGRPDLPAPIHGTWSMPGSGANYGEDGEAFHVWAYTEEELDVLSALLDDPEPVKRPQNSGYRQCFDGAAYEVLLSEDKWSWTPRAVNRAAALEGLGQMFDWLLEREELPLPFHQARGDGVGGPNSLDFVCWVDSGRLPACASLFDRIDHPTGLPAYVPQHVRREFGGGVAYRVTDDEDA